MTPEQLEEVPGIGPKTVEKISIAVNNYFSSLESAEAGTVEEGVPAEGEAPAEGEYAEGEEGAAQVEAAAEGEADAELEDAGEALGQDVSVEEEARELAAEEAVETDEEAGEATDEIDAAARDDEALESEREPTAETDLELTEEGGQAGDEEGLPDVPEASSESVEALADEGQAFEAEVVDGVENAPDADQAELTVHDRPETPNENVPDEEEPGEKRS
jgi:hypothetical protein